MQAKSFRSPYMANHDRVLMSFGTIRAWGDPIPSSPVHNCLFRSSDGRGAALRRVGKGETGERLVVLPQSSSDARRVDRLLASRPDQAFILVPGWGLRCRSLWPAGSPGAVPPVQETADGLKETIASSGAASCRKWPASVSARSATTNRFSWPATARFDTIDPAR